MEGIERPVIIYALTDPDTGEIRYIGQTKNLWQRYALHLTRLEGTSAKVAWLRDLKAKGQVPGLRVLETVAADEANVRERYWITSWRRQGIPLVNQPPGQDIVRWTVYVPLAMKEEIHRLARDRQQPPSVVLQELLWQALHDR